MRVLHVVSSPLFAGVERYISNVAPALAARGCEVTVAGGDQATMRVLLAGSGVIHVPAANLAQTFLQVARCRRFDVVHAHMTSAELAVLGCGPISRAVTVTTRHFAARRGRVGVVRTVSRLVPHLVDQQIAISSFVASAIGEPATVLPNGVPRSESTGPRQPVVLMLQRLEAEKSTHIAIEAWARSRARGGGWRLLIAGAGSEESSLRSLAAALAVEGSVSFLGQRSDVPDLLQSAGILLATAPREPFGLSVVEAMAAGVPVVAAAGGAHLETVGSCRTSYLFEPDDADACADRLDALTDEPASRAAYGAALQEHQRSHFDLDGHVDRLLKIYWTVLERQRPSGPKAPS